MMVIHPYVDDFIQSWRRGEIILNQDRIDLINYLEQVVFQLDDCYFNEQQIDDFVKFTEKWFFKLEPFQKFLISFVFFYQRIEGYEDELVFTEYFWTMARGSGKNGLISALSAYFISPLWGIREYHVAVAGNSEDQAKKSVTEVHNMLNRNKELVFSKKRNPNGLFINGKKEITCVQTMSGFAFLTSNASTKDGFAHAVIIFDEVHEYETDKLIDVLRSGLGKVSFDRTFYISTNGFVREGVYDKMLSDARELLRSETFKSRVFPWICTMDSVEEIETDVTSWQKANPMFHPPLSQYARNLFRAVNEQWNEVCNGRINRARWIIKRMNYGEIETETSVASRAEILATNQPLPDLDGLPCVGGFDFSSRRDFTSVGVLFKEGDNYIWLTHSFVRRGFITNFSTQINEVIPEWEKKGLLTVVNDSSISVERVVEWFVKMREQYGVQMIVGDTFRRAEVDEALQKAGFETDFVRRSTAIQAAVAPSIQVLFADHRIIFGDNPLMRWFTNNVYVKITGDGNMVYQKKDEVRRKTDGFSAFTHAFWKGLDVFPSESEPFLFAGYKF